MKNVIIAASLIGAAAAGVILYMRNRDRADAALESVKDAAKNAYKKMDKFTRKAGRKANHVAKEAMA
ncbi:hypothetical protein [Chitinophaga sp. XS-30]|uniref:hypothetical protein n=1 Tax=Chitinophaga sp. XS-30 TaxID=2604421 RepID=UPI0011DD9F39|nr:hypothetical protein [Chitinophaga sp. XS-30]QEH41243.1 hypothetical protein FW415_10295 [Chitinophaga sp. XS-30]